MPSSTNQKEQLTHSAILSTGFVIVTILFAWFYILPKYNELNESVAAANTSIKVYKETEKDGIQFKDLVPSLKAVGKKDELIKIISEAPEQTKEVIKKEGNAPYLTWLRDAIVLSDSDKDKLILKQARLNSILPTLSPMSNQVTQDTINMRKYVSFVENNILNAFNLESLTALGIQNIKYGQKGAAMPDTVGSFDTEISFKATNDNISKMITYINTLGHPEILSETGTTLSGALPEAMSNPLAYIDGMSLQNPLELSKPNEQNSGRVTIRFFVRGSSESDVSFLADAIKSKGEKIKKNIDAAVAACSTDSGCSKKLDLQNIARKYFEFSRVASGLKSTQGVEAIYSLGAQLDTLNSIEKELNLINSK